MANISPFAPFYKSAKLSNFFFSFYIAIFKNDVTLKIKNSNADLSLSDDSDCHTLSSSLQSCRMLYRKIGDGLKEAALLLDSNGHDNVYDIAAITGFSILTFYHV